MKKLLLFLILIYATVSFSQTAVEKYGQLGVSGSQIVDKNGLPVQLRGMSLYWSQWKPDFYNYNAVKWLRDDWCINVIRIAMAVDVGGYATNPTKEQNKVITVVDAAISLGIYVIIDFHVHEANNYVDEANTFFDAMSKRYGNSPNVIYEIWNEPLDVSWENVIKPYHTQIVSTIRKNDPDNIIVCGTAFWSQGVGDAANNPVAGTNIAYTLHYYADSHKQWLRDNALSAMNKGIALFVTEYGTCNANGNGDINTVESQAWWDFLDQNSIGSCNWSVADLGETSAALYTGTGANGNWTDNDIKPSGKLVRDYLKSRCDNDIIIDPPDCNNTPNGTAYLDDCGICVEGNTGKVACSVIEEGIYQIIPVHSNLFLESNNVVSQQANNGISNQAWQVKKEQNGYYTIINYASGEYLSYGDAQTATQINTSTNTQNTWNFELSGANSYILSPSINTNVVADIGSYSMAPGGLCNLYTRTGGDNQKFIFEPITIDCNNDINGSASIDQCGVCSGGKTGNTACSLQIIEAENACSFDGTIDADQTGYTGNGFINFTNTIGSSATFNLLSPNNQTVNIQLQYANGSADDRNMNIIVNDIEQVSSQAFAPTDAWTNWNKQIITIQLTQGINSIEFISVNSTGGPNFDKVSFDHASGIELSCLVTQTIPLTIGWNLISFNVHPADSSIATLFNGLDVALIKNAESFWIASQSDFLNSMTHLEAGKGYLVKMNTGGTLTVTAVSMSETQSIASLRDGWNIIGCSHQTPTPFATDFNSTNCSIIKNFDGFWIPNGTLNSIENMEPGKGYFLLKN